MLGNFRMINFHVENFFTMLMLIVCMYFRKINFIAVIDYENNENFQISGI